MEYLISLYVDKCPGAEWVQYNGEVGIFIPASSNGITTTPKHRNKTPKKHLVMRFGVFRAKRGKQEFGCIQLLPDAYRDKILTERETFKTQFKTCFMKRVKSYTKNDNSRINSDYLRSIIGEAPDE